MAHYAYAGVGRLIWSGCIERHFSPSDRAYAAFCLEGLDTEDDCDPCATYENLAKKKEELARRLEALQIDDQPRSKVRYQPALQYKLDGKRVGLIVCDTSRDGSQHDIKRVSKFCAQNGFKCYQTNKFTKAGLMKDMRKFRSMLDEDVCCLTIFIMAHGSLGHINVSDGQVELQGIFDMFDNRGCPALRGKPKLFVIQACRGVQRCSNHPCFDASDLSGVRQERLWPVESDSLFVYAVCPGNLAICYPDTGSPLFEEMNNVFSRFGSNYSMHELFTMVNNRLEKRKERVGYKTDRQPQQILQSLKMPGVKRSREASAPVGGPLHIVDRLTKKWYLRAPK